MPRKLSRKHFALYTERKGLSSQISDLEAKLRRLKDERAELDAELLGGALTNGGDRKLPSGRILHIKRVEVAPAVIERKGYTYYKFAEEAADAAG